jgi:hypothetical protein
MDIKMLKQDEMDDVIVSFYKAQEMDAFCHQINIERYESIFKNGGCPDSFKTTIREKLEDTKSRLNEVLIIMKATEPQLPSRERIEASLSRLKDRINK